MTQTMMWVQLSSIRSKRVQKECRLIQEMMWTGQWDETLYKIVKDNWDTDEELDLGVTEI